VNADGALGAGRILYSLSLSLFLRRSQKQTVKLIARLMSLSVRSPDADEEAHKFCCSLRERESVSRFLQPQLDLLCLRRRNFAVMASLCVSNVCYRAKERDASNNIAKLAICREEGYTHALLYDDNGSFPGNKTKIWEFCCWIKTLDLTLKRKESKKYAFFYFLQNKYELYIYLFNDVQKTLLYFRMLKL
jgi:hypothetical protein